MFKFVKNVRTWLWYSVYIGFFLGVVLVDQMSKYLVLQAHGLLPWCIKPTFNAGVSFSIGAHLQSSCLVLAVLACYSFLLWFGLQHHYIGHAPLAYSAIFAGGFSNIIDRCMHGAVVDFIALQFCGIELPIFNFADVCIVCGVLWVIGIVLFPKTTLSPVRNI